MGALGLGQRFHPVGNLVETLVPCIFGHARIHVSVLVGFTSNRCLEVVSGTADWHAGSRIANFFQVFQVTMSMAGFAFCS